MKFSELQLHFFLLGWKAIKSSPSDRRSYARTDTYSFPYVTLDAQIDNRGTVYKEMLSETLHKPLSYEDIYKFIKEISDNE